MAEPPGAPSSAPPGPPPGPQASAPPAPPPGPGVQPPFVAAPIEGRRARTWLGLGVVGGLLAACCGVAGVATVGLLLLSEQMANERAQAAVTDYLDAVMDEHWSEAYELRCEPDRRSESEPDFVRRVSAGPAIESYQVGDLRLEPSGDMFDPDAALPVTLSYADGSQQRVTVPLEQDPNTGEFHVCRTTQV